MEQTERIAAFEARLSRVEAASEALERAIGDFEAAEAAAEALADYYESEAWRRDFDDDEAGRLPPDLRRGVLSEDGIWNALERRRELRGRLKKGGNL